MHQNCFLSAALSWNIYWKMWEILDFWVFYKNIKFSAKSVKTITVYDLLLNIAIYSPKNVNKYLPKTKNASEQSPYIKRSFYRFKDPLCRQELPSNYSKKFFLVINRPIKKWKSVKCEVECSLFRGQRLIKERRAQIWVPLVWMVKWVCHQLHTVIVSRSCLIQLLLLKVTSET